LICVSIVFLSNFLVPSGTNGFTPGFNLSIKRVWDTEHAEQVFESRYSNAEFRRKPMVLGFQKYMNQWLGMPYQFSFNLINYAGLFLFFLLIPALVKSISQSYSGSASIQYFFLLSFPVLFAFYGSISTYDDIIQYLLLVLFLIFLFKEQHVVAALFFLLACISRETSLLYFVVVSAFLWKSRAWMSAKSLLWISPLILYVVYVSYFLDKGVLEESVKFTMEKRFYAWRSNLQDFRTIRESITITFLMLGIPMFLSIKQYRMAKSEVTRFWSRFSVGFILLNWALVFTTALIREARLLLIPLLVAIPMSKNSLQASIGMLKEEWRRFNVVRTGIILLISFLLSFIWFSTLTSGTGYIFKTYAFFYCVVFFELVIAERSLFR
jgi:hypothetical protein